MSIIQLAVELPEWPAGASSDNRVNGFRKQGGVLIGDCQVAGLCERSPLRGDRNGAGEREK